MKTVSVVVPCYNEEENVAAISEAIVAEFKKLPQYDYEIIFIDNDSKDNTRLLIRGLCAQNPRIRAIFNAKNFGQFNSPFYGLLQVNGDCGILMAADFQEPPTLIPEFIKGWEEGFKIVAAIKTKSQENRFMYWLRGVYYKMIKRLSDVEQIEQFTGFGLYDRDFIEVLKKLDDPTPFLRGIVAELGYRRKDIEFEQPQRRAGKTSNNFFRLFDAAMLSFTSYTTVGLRLATFLGMMSSCVFILIAVIYLILKLVNWDNFPAGMAPVLIGMCTLGSVQLFFIGLIGEYIMSINARVKHRPLVVEEERINFNGKKPEINEKRPVREYAAQKKPVNRQ
ncbi:MAG: glycosyltransferase family 2 protein, partial [Parasporobacterium sp.]|nr:glycosyltransferase family 2 protein [Parasporobacterium sp.]